MIAHLTTRSPSTREQIILLESSKLHGCRFPPWKTPPINAEFELRDGEALFLYVLVSVFDVKFVKQLNEMNESGMRRIFGSQTYKWNYLMPGADQKKLYPHGTFNSAGYMAIRAPP